MNTAYRHFQYESKYHVNYDCMKINNSWRAYFMNTTHYCMHYSLKYHEKPLKIQGKWKNLSNYPLKFVRKYFRVENRMVKKPLNYAINGYQISF